MSPSAGVLPSSLPVRVASGFAAGSVAVLVFSSGAIAALNAAGIVPFAAWSLAPVPPFGVPHIVSSAFWGGAWGVAYALIQPRLSARLAWWSGGILFGVLPLIGFWFVALPLKGLAVAAWLVPARIVEIGLHVLFGVATAGLFRLAGKRARDRFAPPQAIAASDVS